MITNAKQAKAEATRRRIEQSGLNRDEAMELGYSPSTFAVGCRHWGSNDDGTQEPFRVFNTNYPMYGKNDQVNDWVSVGIARSIGERGPIRFHN